MAAVERALVTGSAADFIPPRPSLRTLRDAAQHCRGCKLWMVGTQTVFGEGPAKARVIIVGEQPGDEEDKQGHPFVGPAGRFLDAALEEAGIARDEVYVTNAVKHFKWERGEKSKRRIHKKPNDGEVRACRPWLDQELALVKPEVVICLGATAAQSLLGKSFKVTQSRGKKLSAPFARAVFATVHPSSILRAPDAAARADARRAFIADLRKVARYLGAGDREVVRRPRRGD
ncbi:MAG TPA: UdgX family uracil-DNA binding protein [Gemmatimonadaceae bacterium]|nr:UdgX family uracil-DNA binding protein [Gemmatimonadaceae bacterium]